MARKFVENRMTRKLPNADQAVVDRRKIVDYLLSRRHPDGRNKAAFFFAFGSRTARWERFAEALRTHGRNGTVTGRAESAYGVRYSVDGVVETPDGRNPRVRTVWVIASEGEEPRLVTAHPLRR